MVFHLSSNNLFFMKQSVVFLLMFTIVGAVMAQGPIYKVKNYPNGEKRYEGYFLNGKPVGEFKRYHENGILNVLQVFDEQRNSTVEIYAGDGSKLASGKFVNQKEEGEWLYFGEKGNVASKEFYKNGVHEGDAFIYAPTGEILDVRHYEAGKLEGRRTQYYLYGHILAQFFYVRGVLEGPYVSYYETGEEDEIGAYASGKKTGVWRTYFEDGTFKEIEYKDGLPTDPVELKKMLDDEFLSEQGDSTIIDPEDYKSNPEEFFLLDK